MEGILNKEQIEYVLFHLNLVVEINDNIKKHMVFLKIDEPFELENKIVFRLSDQKFNVKNINYTDDLPVLFPIENQDLPFIEKNNSIIFSHDFLKSAFYLLSGYQEYISSDEDFKGRFPYENSIQEKLNIIRKPVVNYYFDILKKGIKQFCEKNSITFKEKRMFETFGFFLSHDIDWIDKYVWNYTGYKIKEFLGLVKTDLSKKQLLQLLFKAFWGHLKLSKNNNPYWNFNFLQKTEDEFGFKSTYFFLPKEEKHVDAYYDFEDSRLVKLYKTIRENGNEIGLHGTVNSSISEESMKKGKNKLEKVVGYNVTSIRQHRLSFKMPDTFRIMEKTGLKVDTSLGFAAHEGFRNSFCLPFKPFDFENNRMIDIWEIPLNVMDGTLFNYRKYNYDEAFENINLLLKEIIKFNGTFSLLWHNTYFDEIENRGITEFYIKILGYIKAKNPEIVTNPDFNI